MWFCYFQGELTRSQMLNQNGGKQQQSKSHRELNLSTQMITFTRNAMCGRYQGRDDRTQNPIEDHN